MKFEYVLRGKRVVLSELEDAIAIRPKSEVRAEATAAQTLKRFNTATASDDSAGGKFGLSLPASDRKLFERAGWLFAEPQAELVNAAATREAVQSADAVRPVFVDRGGNTLIGTDIVTVQLPAEMASKDAIATLKEHGLLQVRRLQFAPNLFETRLKVGGRFQEVINHLQDTPIFRFAEPVMLEAVGGRAHYAPPASAEYKRQWQHRNNGSNGGQANADIQSQPAWLRATGAGIRIAVIDNGMQVTHPGLSPAIKTGAYFESDGQASATWVGFQPGGSGFPSGHHGTFCLGMAGARPVNATKGVCGSAPQSELVPIACLSDQVGSQVTLARALAYAANPSTEDGSAHAEDGAHVIACSLGPSGAGVWNMTSVLELAISTAAQQGRGGKGVPLFWAVSNSYNDIANDEVCSHPSVIAVGRSTRNDDDDGSAYGAKLDFLAPGREVYSTTAGGKYRSDTGTSYACPLTAGVAALVLERHPQWTRDEVLNRLRASCDQIGGAAYVGGHHPDFGYGRINADKATQ